VMILFLAYLFVRAVTNKNKPNPVEITSKDGKTLLREFHKLTIKRGVLYGVLNDNGEEKCHLVFPSAFREQALRCARDDIGHLRSFYEIEYIGQI